MKKTKFMRAALLLLVLTLITSCFVGGTFAKYTTSTTGNDSARVAYWGFNENASTTINLFSKTYNNVSSAEKVVAPGTENSAEFGFKYTSNTAKNVNAPEVAYDLKVEANATGSYADLDKNPNFKWTLKDGRANAATMSYDTVAELLDAINAFSGTYEAGKLPAAFGTADANAKCTVGWKWAFETAGDKMSEQDKTDTDMGNAANPDNVANLDNVALTITITATQKD